MIGDSLANALPGLLPRLWRFALRLAGDRHDAEDLLQRTCVRALERREQVQAGTSLLSWMFRVMHTVWLNELRSRQIRSRSSLEWSDEMVETIADPSASNPETVSLHREIIAAVNALPDAQRVVMLLVAVEGFSYRDAAEVLDLPIGTVMSRLARARMTVGERFGGRTNVVSQQKGGLS